MAGQTESGLPIEPVYDSSSLAGFDPATALGAPGSFRTPARASNHVRGRLWTMRHMRLRVPPPSRTAVTASSLPPDDGAVRGPSTCRRRWATTRRPIAAGEVGSSAVASGLDRRMRRALRSRSADLGSTSIDCRTSVRMSVDQVDASTASRARVVGSHRSHMRRQVEGHGKPRRPAARSWR